MVFSGSGGDELLIPVRLRQRTVSEKLAVSFFWISIGIIYVSGVMLAINNTAVQQSDVPVAEILPEWWVANRPLVESLSIYCIGSAGTILVRYFDCM